MKKTLRGVVELDYVWYDWSLCHPCRRLHLLAAPCLTTDNIRDGLEFPCFWNDGWPYLAYEIGLRADWRRAAVEALYEMHRRGSVYQLGQASTQL